MVYLKGKFAGPRVVYVREQDQLLEAKLGSSFQLFRRSPSAAIIRSTVCRTSKSNEEGLRVKVALTWC